MENWNDVALGPAYEDGATNTGRYVGGAIADETKALTFGSSREIGERLEISMKTVEAHRARINDKMRADDLHHLVRMVMAYHEEHGT